MRKRLAIEPHLSLQEVEHRYRNAKDPVERSHWQIVWLLGQGKSTRQIVEYTGYSQSWIRTIAHRYNEGGPAALGDRRRDNPGAQGILTPELQQRLRQEIQADEGKWTGNRVAAWIQEHTGRQVHPQRGWEYLKRLSRPSHDPSQRLTKADSAE
jgi:transposase